MFERFNDDARDAITKSQSLCAEFGYEEISPELIFLGMAYLGYYIFDNLGLVKEDLETKLNIQIQQGGYRSGHIPFSAESKKCIQDTIRESLSRNDDYIGPQHLLLSILKNQENFSMAGISYSEVDAMLEAEKPTPTSEPDPKHVATMRQLADDCDALAIMATNIHYRAIGMAANLRLLSSEQTGVNV